MAFFERYFLDDEELQKENYNAYYHYSEQAAVCGRILEMFGLDPEYGHIINGSQIDWRIEAKKAADNKIKIDTVTITDAPWFRELSAMTNGVSVPFHTRYKPAELVRASVMSRGSMKARCNFDVLMGSCEDDEMKEVYASYKKERDNIDF